MYYAVIDSHTGVARNQKFARRARAEAIAKSANKKEGGNRYTVKYLGDARKKNPAERFYEIRRGTTCANMKLVWTTGTVGDAKFIAKTMHQAYPKEFVSVKRVR